MLDFNLHIRLPGLSLHCEYKSDARVIALIGPNGGGKSTLLRTLLGAQEVEEGHLRVGCDTWLDSAQGAYVPIEKRAVAYVPQSGQLFPHLNVLDNVRFGLRGSGAKESMARALEQLERLGCIHLKSRSVSRLSGGEKARIALARALVLQPKLLLLDECLAALDTTSAEGLRELLKESISELSCPTILVTHNPRDLIALDAETAVMERGTLSVYGRFEELKRNPSSPFVESFTSL